MHTHTCVLIEVCTYAHIHKHICTLITYKIIPNNMACVAYV